MAIIEKKRDAVRAPSGREVEPPRNKASYTGRGGIGNIQHHYRDPDLFHRVITYERGVIQAANESSAKKVTFGRGGLGNKAKKKEPLASDSASIKAVSIRTVSENRVRTGGYGRGGFGNRPKKKEGTTSDSASQKTSSTDSSRKSRFFFKSKGKKSIGTSSSSSVATSSLRSPSVRSSIEPSLWSNQSSYLSTPLMTPSCSTPVSATFSQFSMPSEVSRSPSATIPEDKEDWESPRARILDLPPRRVASPRVVSPLASPNTPNFCRPLPPRQPPPTRVLPPDPTPVGPPAICVAITDDDDDDADTVNFEMSETSTVDIEASVADPEAFLADVETSSADLEASGSDIETSTIANSDTTEMEPADDDESVNGIETESAIFDRSSPLPSSDEGEEEDDDDFARRSMVSLAHEMPDLPQFDHDFELDFDFYAEASRFPIPPTHDPYTISLPANVSRYSLEAIDEQLPSRGLTPIAV